MQLRFRVAEATRVAPALRLNGTPLPTDRREPNPYRNGGIRVARAQLRAALHQGENVLEVEL